MAKAPPCPCGSGLKYPACCRPYHRGLKQAEDCPTLVRARYSAFALRELEFLWETLHPDHEDRSRPKDVVMLELRRAAQASNYPSLQILDSREDGDSALVLFRAGIFEKGRDHSFVELSDFGRTEAGWGYRSGTLKAAAGLPAALTIDQFEAMSD